MRFPSQKLPLWADFSFLNFLLIELLTARAAPRGARCPVSLFGSTKAKLDSHVGTEVHSLFGAFSLPDAVWRDKIWAKAQAVNMHVYL